jgi:glycosyltransferase involved in cell wall biosynthesis
MKKILFTDVPFAADNSEYSERSRFIWSVLSRSYEADLLLIKTPGFLTRKVPETSGYEQLHTLVSTTPNPLKPKSVLQFSRENEEKFRRILLNKKYDLIFFRSPAFQELAAAAQDILPECRIVIDIDKLQSRTDLQSIKQSQSRQNLISKVEAMQLQMQEKNLLKQPWDFFLSSPSHLKAALNITGISGETSNFHLLPTPLVMADKTVSTGDKSAQEQTLLKDKFILFYGDLQTENNLDAFAFIAKELYGRVSKLLQKKDIKIYIAGRNPQPLHQQLSGGRIKLIGHMDEPGAYLQACQFVLLPLRKGTSFHRIREAAIWHKSVVTTPAGSLEYEFCRDAMAVADTADAIAVKIMELVNNPMTALELGQKLYDKMFDMYEKSIVEQKFRQSLEQILSYSGRMGAARFKVAIVTDNFGTDSGRIGNHVFQLANKLSQTCEITVLCPGKNEETEQEKSGNLTVWRFRELFRLSAPEKRKGRKSFCPSLALHLLRNDYDIVQCYGSASPNCLAAYLAGKLREIPVVLNVFEVPDPDPDKSETRRNASIPYLQRLLFQNADHIFTVTEKDYNCLRSLNPRVEQIPLPVEIQIKTADLPDVKQKYNLKQDSFVFLCLGKFSRVKGQDIALQAFAKALPFLPGAKLVIVGKTDAETDYYEELELLVSREGLHGDVLFTDEVDNNEVVAWLQTADIQIVPARHMHIGNVVIESWACGTPVLQSDSVDPNLVEDGYNGFLFRSGDAEDLSQQMQNAYNRQAQLAAMAVRGRELVTHKYTYDYLAERYLEAYKQLTL